METPTNHPSGLRVREIATKVVQQEIDGVLVDVTVPLLDEDGREIELSSVVVPQRVEAEGGDAVDAHVLEQLTAPTIPAVPDSAENPPTLAEGAE
jgi:hypothetical protein